MTRTEYILQQKKEHGRTALAVLPIHYPKEILTAMDVLAVELWGPPGPPRGDQAGRIQTYVCPVVRNAIAFLGAGGAAAVDGLLFPHTCDSIQGLATVVPDFGGFAGPVFRFNHPKGGPRPHTVRYLERELRTFADGVAGLTGSPLDEQRLGWAIGLHRKIDAARADLLDRRARLPLSDPELYRLLRRGEWLWPEHHLTELEAARLTLTEQPVQTGVPVLVTGYVPEPAGFLDCLHDSGGVIVADDYAAIGRRVVRTGDGPAGAPFKALVDLAFARPPCPTLAADSGPRIERLVRLARDSGARGAILHLMKFCEPELFDVPAIRAAFEREGLPLLYLETEMEADLPGQAATRIEAFVESVAGKGGRR